MTPKPRLVFLASGEGRLFQAAGKHLSRIQSADVVGLVTQKAQAGCVEKARELNIPVHVVPSDPMLEFDQRLAEILKRLNPDFIVLAGYTRKISAEIVGSYAGRIVNSHPSLLPKYGGQGMYGRKVHEAVIRNKEKVTGISLHVVDEEYDQGPVFSQKEVPVYKEDSPESLEERVKAVEREFFPLALERWLKAQQPL